MTESKYVNAFEAIDAVLTQLGYVNNKAGESMSKPKRIQRKRTKGWKMPENAVYVGRPTKWGNPYLLSDHSRQDAVDLYGDYLRSEIAACSDVQDELIDELRGKDLACWCSLDHPCHADVLLELANS